MKTFITLFILSVSSTVLAVENEKSRFLADAAELAGRASMETGLEFLVDESTYKENTSYGSKNKVLAVTSNGEICNIERWQAQDSGNFSMSILCKDSLMLGNLIYSQWEIPTPNK